MSSNKDASAALQLDDGRTVAVDGQSVEIRAAGGEVELRIKLTPEGPVLQLEGVKVEINAAESIAMKTKNFSVDASESLTLGTEGDLKVTSTGEMTLNSVADMIVKGKIIWLN